MPARYGLSPGRGGVGPQLGGETAARMAVSSGVHCEGGSQGGNAGVAVVEHVLSTQGLPTGVAALGALMALITAQAAMTREGAAAAAAAATAKGMAPAPA
jgi:hypothetical protein